jgi:hypothetical protein
VYTPALSAASGDADDPPDGDRAGRSFRITAPGACRCLLFNLIQKKLKEAIMDDQTINEPVSEIQINLSGEAMAYLATTRKWTLFLSVMGFIVSGFIMIAGTVITLVMAFLNTSAFMPERLPYGWFAALYFVIGAVYFVGSYFLYRFSAQAKQALASHDAAALTEAFRNLRTHYVIVGGSIISAIVLYIAVTVGIIFFSLSFSRNPFSSAYDAQRVLHPKFENTIVDPADHRVFYDSSIAHPSVIQTDESGSRVYYDGAVISNTDAKGAGAVLEMIGYFNSSHRNLDAFYYKKDGRYIIAFAVNQSALSDEDVSKALKKGIGEFRKTYGDRVYHFRLMAIDAHGSRRDKVVGED